MNESADLKHAKTMMNACLAFVLLCVALAIIAYLYATVWTAISGIVACGLAVHAFMHWRKKYLTLKKKK